MHSRTALLLISTATVALLFTVGCGQSVEEDDVASSNADLTNSDQAGVDVQVLQVWTPGRAFPLAPQGWQGPGPNDVNMNAADPHACTTLRTWTSQPASTTYEDREVDCTAALSKATPFDVTGAPGPVMTPARFHITKRVSDGYLFVDPDFCNRIEMRVVVRDAAVSTPSFTGIGFYSSRGDTFTPKADLQAVGHVRLARGDEATVYRFTGISTCISSAHSSTSGNMYQTFSFKPYAAYDTAGESGGGEGVRYRVWESIQGNHTIGRSWPGSTPNVDALAFDRQNDLLAH